MDQPQRRHQSLRHAPRRGDVHRGGEAVVRRLAHVDMVVGMDRALAAARPRQPLVGAPGDHLVGIHVRLGAAAGLPDDQRELPVEIAPCNFLRRLLDRFGQLGVEPADPRIDPRRGLLDEPQRVDDFARHPLAWSEREIADRPLGLGAPIRIAGDVDRPETVGLTARAAGHVGSFFYESKSPASARKSASGRAP